MSLHDNLDAFFDGELPPTEAAAFRAHLSMCIPCALALQGRMLEQAVLADAPGRRETVRVTPHFAPRPRRTPELARAAVLPQDRPPRSWSAAQAVIMVCGVAIAWFVTRPRDSALALAPRRGTELRFTAPALDRYRPLQIMASAGLPFSRESFEPAAVSALDGRARMAAHALAGDIGSARRVLQSLPRSSQTLSDEAALVLLEHDGAPLAVEQAADERALSLTVEALRLDRRCTQALWNQAIILRRLQLPLAAASVFDEVAARDEPGWADEARTAASQIRTAYAREKRSRDDLKARSAQMASGGAAVPVDDAHAAPDLVRRALYDAVAGTADPRRLAELLPIARALDADLGTSSLGELVARIRGSDLAARAPLAAVFATVPVTDEPAVQALRARAVAANVPDIALACTLRVREWMRDDGDRAAIASLGPATGDVWWQLVALDDLGFSDLYDRHEYARIERELQPADAICAQHPIALWCASIAGLSAAGLEERGASDRAYQQRQRALTLARSANDRDLENRLLRTFGQLDVNRVSDGVDPIAVAGAELREVVLREPGDCRTARIRGEYLAHAALQLHRFADAGALIEEAAQAPNCTERAGWYGAEPMRGRILAHSPTAPAVATFRARLDGILDAAGGEPDLRPLFDSLIARASIGFDRDRAQTALWTWTLRAELGTWVAPPGALDEREHNYAALAESYALDHDADRAIDAIALALRVEPHAGCVVGISHADRDVVVVRDAGGRAELAIRDVPEGRERLEPDALFSAEMLSRLATCAHVDVLATYPYFGVARLLPAGVPWAYRVESRPAPEPRTHGELVVTDVAAPPELHLPPLTPIEGSRDALLLRGRAATPRAVLRTLETADSVIINAHGLSDERVADATSLVLAPDPDGNYLLTTAMLSGIRLRGAPLVVLAACNAGRVGSGTWNLAAELVGAGARAVVASAVPISNETANEVFSRIRASTKGGTDAAAAVAAERLLHGQRISWSLDLLVFE